VIYYFRVDHHGGGFELVVSFDDLPLSCSDQPNREAQLWCCKSDPIIFMDEIRHSLGEFADGRSDCLDRSAFGPESDFILTDDEGVFTF
jgi:hypothetical protein